MSTDMALCVKGRELCNSNGEVIQLHGISTHGIAWYPQYINRETFRTFRDDWNINIIRLAMYTAELDGYCNGGDQEQQKQLIRDGVKYASELGLYVIIDWHILSDKNPMDNKDEAIAFFDQMSAEFAGYDNVIYEICNEPQESPWDTVIRPYAEEILSVIRANAPRALVLVGTDQWSQKLDEVIGHELADPNVMYVLHFYAATHREQLRKTMKDALDAGLPVFISECSICDASGNGSIDYESADEWMKLIDEYKVSFICWNLSNKDEASAILKPDVVKISDWTMDELNDTARYFREQNRKHS
jgi:endoglucanase